MPSDTMIRLIQASIGKPLYPSVVILPIRRPNRFC
jgi:hypothetical protein